MGGLTWWVVKLPSAPWLPPRQFSVSSGPSSRSASPQSESWPGPEQYVVLASMNHVNVLWSGPERIQEHELGH